MLGRTKRRKDINNPLHIEKVPCWKGAEYYISRLFSRTDAIGYPLHTIMSPFIWPITLRIQAICHAGLPLKNSRRASKRENPGDMAQLDEENQQIKVSRQTVEDLISLLFFPCYCSP